MRLRLPISAQFLFTSVAPTPEPITADDENPFQDTSGPPPSSTTGVHLQPTDSEAESRDQSRAPTPMDVDDSEIEAILPEKQKKAKKQKKSAKETLAEQVTLLRQGGYSGYQSCSCHKGYVKSINIGKLNLRSPEPDAPSKPTGQGTKRRKEVAPPRLALNSNFKEEEEEEP